MRFNTSCMDNMSSISCVQNAGGLIGAGDGVTIPAAAVTPPPQSTPLGGGSYHHQSKAESSLPSSSSSQHNRPLIMKTEPQSPAQGGWHMHPITTAASATVTAATMPSMKEEIIERDERTGNDSGISSAYTPGSDGFRSSSSPGASDHSRDSDPAAPAYAINSSLENTTPPNFYNPQLSSAFLANNLYQAYNGLTLNCYENAIHNNNDVMASNRNTGFNSMPHPDIRSSGSSESEDSDQYYKEDGGDSGQPSPRGSEHDSMDDDKSAFEPEEDESNLRSPRVNSHGKVKIFKCKQCEFAAVTKLDFWNHTRGHIKSEKLLTCPKCPFVTEYKHHLEYHLRNHFGSKPFKCDKCNYSCVNKSMLNSHLKSHSNVYQYRCSDCAYATKYCHSLKLHLRKYNHKPAMVLNPDGSPNPLPIIDVYGTRRGPKQRGLKGEDSNSQPAQSPPLPAATAVQAPPVPHPMFPSHFMFPNGTQPPPVPAHFSFGQLLNAFQGNMPNPLLFPHNNNNIEKPQVSPVPEPPASPIKFTCDKCEFMADTAEALDAHKATVHIEIKQEVCDTDVSQRAPGALDLSKGPNETVPSMPTTPTTTKNRRKGRAFKLGHVALKLQHAEESDDETSAKKLKFSDQSENEEEEPPQQAEIPQPEIEVKKPEEDIKKTYNCQFCDIVFKDVIMYTMHMGYHGFNDPFTCNMCGEQTSDAVAFFLHIARTSHS